MLKGGEMSNRYAPPGAAVDNAGLGGSAISAEMIDALRGTKGWVLLIGILLFIAGAITVIAALGIGFSGWVAGRSLPNGPPAGVFLGMGAMYLIMAIIDILLGLYLVRYSSAIGRLLQNGDASEMEAALHAQRKFWKLASVLSLIMIVIFILGIIAAIAIPAYTAYNARLLH